MISLLPPDHKSALVYARRNTRLRTGVIGLSIGLIFLVLVATGSFLIMRQEVTTYNNNATAIEAELSRKGETTTIKRMNNISNTLNLVVKVLSEQVLFAELFQQVGTTMPDGSILQNLSLTGDMTSGIDLQIGSVDYNTGTQVLVNFQDPNNKIFEKADLISLTCADPTNTEGPYYCTANIRATFQKESQFSFLKRQTEQAAAQATGAQL